MYKVNFFRGETLIKKRDFPPMKSSGEVIHLSFKHTGRTGFAT